VIFTAVCSRHMFVWLCHGEKLTDVLEGCEAAWAFFGGVFKVMIPDNLSPVVASADATAPRFTVAFTEYAQARGFVIDPARVRHPQDKPRVERTVSYVRGSFWAGETFRDLADAQRHAEGWCLHKAGMRVHGTTQARPLEVFRLEEAPRLLPAPAEPYDLPIYRTWFASDFAIEIRGFLTEVERPVKAVLMHRLEAGWHRAPPCVRAARVAQRGGCFVAAGSLVAWGAVNVERPQRSEDERR
jgi:hypothetical protein